MGVWTNGWRVVIQIEYGLSTSVSNLHAMYQPTFSVSSAGTVPKRRSGMQPICPVYYDG